METQVHNSEQVVPTEECTHHWMLDERNPPLGVCLKCGTFKVWLKRGQKIPDWAKEFVMSKS